VLELFWGSDIIMAVKKKGLRENEQQQAISSRISNPSTLLF